MGVDGLWQLLEPVGRRVDIKALAGKRLAVDASIWIFQFLKVMRDDKGDFVRNGHLLGFFRRICRLLFNQIKPVFVFDGATPTLKRLTVAARRRRREVQEAKVRKTAEKLLLTKLRQQLLAEEKARRAVKKGPQPLGKLTHATASAPADAAAGAPAAKRLKQAQAAAARASAATDAAANGTATAQMHEVDEEDVPLSQRRANGKGPSASKARAAPKLTLPKIGSAAKSARKAAPASAAPANDASAPSAAADVSKAERPEAGTEAGPKAAAEGAAGPSASEAEQHAGANGAAGGAAGAEAPPRRTLAELMAALEDDVELDEAMQVPEVQGSYSSDEEDMELDMDALLAAPGDLDPEAIQSLPPSLQLEIITKMRDRQTVENRMKFQETSACPQGFSGVQMKMFLKRTDFRRKVDEVRDRMNAAAGVRDGAARHVSADADRRFVLEDYAEDDAGVTAGVAKARLGGVVLKRGNLRDWNKRLMKEAKERRLQNEKLKAGDFATLGLAGSTVEAPAVQSLDAEPPSSPVRNDAQEEVVMELDLVGELTADEVAQGLQGAGGAAADGDDEIEWEDAAVGDMGADDGSKQVSAHDPLRSTNWKERAAFRNQYWSRLHGFKMGRKLGDWSDELPSTAAPTADGEHEPAVMGTDDPDSDENLQAAIMQSLQSGGMSSGAALQTAADADVAGPSGFSMHDTDDEGMIVRGAPSPPAPRPAASGDGNDSFEWEDADDAPARTTRSLHTHVENSGAAMLSGASQPTAQRGGVVARQEQLSEKAPSGRTALDSGAAVRAASSNDEPPVLAVAQGADTARPQAPSTSQPGQTDEERRRSALLQYLEADHSADEAAAQEGARHIEVHEVGGGLGDERASVLTEAAAVSDGGAAAALAAHVNSTSADALERETAPQRLTLPALKASKTAAPASERRIPAAAPVGSSHVRADRPHQREAESARDLASAVSGHATNGLTVGTSNDVGSVQAAVRGSSAAAAQLDAPESDSAALRSVAPPSSDSQGEERVAQAGLIQPDDSPDDAAARDASFEDAGPADAPDAARSQATPGPASVAADDDMSSSDDIDLSLLADADPEVVSTLPEDLRAAAASYLREQQAEAEPDPGQAQATTASRSEEAPVVVVNSDVPSTSEFVDVARDAQAAAAEVRQASADAAAASDATVSGRGADASASASAGTNGRGKRGATAKDHTLHNWVQGQDRKGKDKFDLETSLNSLMGAQKSLKKAFARQVGQQDVPTDAMYRDCQELLQHFGIPYIIAPMEAEAQCAWLDENGLVDGVITDDNDVFLFGGNTVYRHFFEEKQFCEEFIASDLIRELGLSRERLTLLAMLLGSDYTEGIAGIGIVNAMETIQAFASVNELKEFRKWLESPDLASFRALDKRAQKLSNAKGKRKRGQEDEEAQTDSSSQSPADVYKATHRTVSKNWQLPDNFPDAQIIDAYANPSVDTSKERFEFRVPDIEVLARYCERNFGWTSDQVETLLLPVVKAYENRQMQLSMDAFVTKAQRFAKIRSKRLQAAIMGVTGAPMSAELIMVSDAEALPASPDEKAGKPGAVAAPGAAAAAKKAESSASRPRRSGRKTGATASPAPASVGGCTGAEDSSARAVVISDDDSEPAQLHAHSDDEDIDYVDADVQKYFY